MRNKNTKIQKNNIKEEEENSKTKFHFDQKWHCFHMWVLNVGIKFLTTISICHNRQNLHGTHTIGVSFGNCKPS